MPLSAAQKTALKNDIAANTTTIGGVQIKDIPHNGDGAFNIALWYSGQASPDFTVWKTNVSVSDIGKKFNGTELAGLTATNLERLNTIALYSSNGVNPSLADQRAFFDDVFSGAGGTATRPALLALWKRLAKRIEQLLSTGTGSDAVPATMGYEGSISGNDIFEAWAS